MTLLTYMLQYTQYTLEIVSYMLDCARICCDNSSVYDPLETTYMLNYVKYMFRYHRLYTFTITHICFTVVNIYDTQHQYIC